MAYIPNEKYTHPGKTTTGGKGITATAVTPDPSMGYASPDPVKGYGNPIAKNPFMPNNPYSKQKMGPGRDKSALSQAMTPEQPIYRGGGNPLYGGGSGQSSPYVNLSKLDYGPWSCEGTYYNPYSGEALGGRENRFADGNSAYGLLGALGGNTNQAPAPTSQPAGGNRQQVFDNFINQWRGAGSPNDISGGLLEALNQARSNSVWSR